jgi:predicted transcriptional regulator
MTAVPKDGASPRRVRMELYHDVLSCIKNGECVPSRISYECNISWAHFQALLESLVQKGYVHVKSIDSRNSHVTITEEGERILGELKIINSLIGYQPR